MALVPGLAIASYFKDLKNIERFAVSFGFSFLILACLTPLFACGLDILGRVIFILVIVSSVLYLKRVGFSVTSELMFIALILAISLVSKFFVQTLWEYPVSGGDWMGHTFIIPYAFDIGKWAPPRDRTPFFNLLIYSYHHLLGTSLYQYWISQIISVVANSVFVLPAYLMAKKVFDDRVAKASVAFMVVAPWLVWQSIYTWPKNLAMYFILLMIYFMFFKQDNKTLNYGLSGLFGALAFLTHNYTLFYILIALMAFIYVKKICRRPLTILQEFFKGRFVYFFIVLAVAIVPYLLWVYSSYGELPTTRLIYYPFSVKGYEQAVFADPREIFEIFFRTPISYIIGIRISNAVVTLTPVVLPINPIATNFPTYHPALYYMQDYPGGLSSLMYILVVVWLFRYLFRKTKTDTVLVTFVAAPLVLTLIIAGWQDWGLLTYALSPTVPILIMLGTNELYRFKTSRIRSVCLCLMFVVCLVEGLIFSVLINDLYLATGGLGSVIEQGSQIPGFQISSFISAHFLLGGIGGFTVNAAISLLLILVIIYYLTKIMRATS